MKRKKGSASRYRMHAITIAKKIAKHLAGWQCERCGCTEKRKIQGSHVISVATSGILAADPYNIISLCVGCHIYRWHKNPHEAVARFDSRRPGRYEELRNKNVTNGSLGIVYWEKIYNENKAIYDTLTGV